MVLIQAAGRGGLENVLTIISNELIKRGHRVRVIQELEPIYSEWKDTMKEFYVLDSSMTAKEVNTEDIAYKYKEFIEKEGKPDVILATHVPLMTYVCCRALVLSGLVGTIPIISWIHGSLFCYGGDKDGLLGFADAHFAISSQIKAELEALNENKPIYLVNNPVNFGGKLIERDEEKLNIMYLGRLSPEKRIHTLLQALEGLSGKWELNVYGDGIEREGLSLMAKDLAIDENIRWHGWIDNAWESVEKADLLVLPSQYEGFPLVVLEALSKGIPVASSKVSGVLSCIEEGVNGWLFDIGDYNQLGEILNRIQSDKSILPSREVCIESVEKYSVKNITDNFENCILKVYKRKKDSIKINCIINDIKDDKDLSDNLKSLNNIDIEQVKTEVLKYASTENISVLNKIAIMNYNSENYDYVFPYLQIAYEMDNSNEETLYNLAVLLYNVKEYEMALGYLKGIKNKDIEVLELENLINEGIK